MPATPNANTSPSNAPFPLRVATDLVSPAITRLINAAFVVERPIFDHDRIDDAGVRDYMTKGKFLLHEDVDAAKNLLACVYLEPNSSDARCYLGLLSIAPDQQSAGLGHRILAQSRKLRPRPPAATRSGSARSARASRPCAPTTNASATNS